MGLVSRTITIRVKTGSTWVVIKDVKIDFYVFYKDFSYSADDITDIDIRNFELPAWANFYSDQIKKYISNFPSKLYYTYNGGTLNVD